MSYVALGAAVGIAEGFLQALVPQQGKEVRDCLLCLKMQWSCQLPDLYMKLEVSECHMTYV